MTSARPATCQSRPSASTSPPEPQRERQHPRPGGQRHGERQRLDAPHVVEPDHQQDHPAEGEEGEAGRQRDRQEEVEEEGDEVERAGGQVAVRHRQGEGEGEGQGEPGEQPHLGGEQEQRPRRLARAERVLEQEALEPVIEIPEPAQLGADPFEVVAGG